MVYQYDLTKFVVLRIVYWESAEQVAYQCVDIFTLLSAPYILYSDNGREFVNDVINKLTDLL